MELFKQQLYLLYNEYMKKVSTRTVSKSKKYHIIFDRNSNVIYESAKYFKEYDIRAVFKIIYAKDQPIFKWEAQEK